MKSTTIFLVGLIVMGVGLFGDNWIFITIGLGFIGYSLLKRKPMELGEGETGPIRQVIKKVVLQRQKGKCGQYGCKYSRNLELHHIIPRNLGGDNRVSNLIYLCPNHHSQAHETRKGKVNFNGIPKYLKRPAWVGK